MKNVNSPKNLKNFFIKLISIVIAVIIIFNVLFNYLFFNSKYLNTLFSLTELENRRQYADNLRDELKKLLEKDNLIREEDKILLYKLYNKIKLEFKYVKLEK